MQYHRSRITESIINPSSLWEHILYLEPTAQLLADSPLHHPDIPFHPTPTSINKTIKPYILFVAKSGCLTTEKVLTVIAKELPNKAWQLSMTFIIS